MSGAIDLTDLITSMENALRAEFPGWQISRETSGRWTATRPGSADVRANNAIELREWLRRLLGEDGAR